MAGTTVYVVRHGRTPLNAEGRFRGLQDPPLDDVGRAEARAAATWLERVALPAVHTSPLRRARETARPITTDRPFAPATLPLVVDLDHGRWTGMTAEQAAAFDPGEFERFRDDPRSCVPPAGERVLDLERRMSEALRWLADRFPGSAVAVVTHEIPIRILLASVTALTGSQMWELEVPTGSILELRVDADGASVVTMPFAPDGEP